eukprot:gnl/Hemi2/18565_TR6135_c0_g1_i1.p2 gnl/Hemi2/18565_TR6135_c0_g1~~gnl/Hemi2/18565_TR6135_c0_g1_i1.p2  ORF type:complete len:215 (-),score=61.22 gnl/Hemi2/18565_TR6135_c0_g1_i1:98-742(-)
MEKARWNWIERMGIHEAFHRNTMNRVIHWMMIPLIFFGYTLALCQIPLFNLPLGADASVRVDAALVVLLLASGVFVLADAPAGFLALVLLMLQYLTAHRLGAYLATFSIAASSPVAAFVVQLVVGVAIAVGALGIQTGVGHTMFEGGLDDQERNINELKATWSLPPIALIFFYHLLPPMFACGYKPKLAAQIQAVRDRVIKNDPVFKNQYGNKK